MSKRPEVISIRAKKSGDTQTVADRRNIRNRKMPLAKLDVELGTMSDTKLAHKYNVSPAHVRARRRELCIAPCKGPAKGQGGRPLGPKRINLGTVRVLESTAAWLGSRGQTAAQALDALSGSNV